MSHLTYYAYPAAGVEKQKTFHYSQAVRIGDRIECAGQGKKNSNKNYKPTAYRAPVMLCNDIYYKAPQLLLPRANAFLLTLRIILIEISTGGWDPTTGVFEKEINAQIDLAFANVERNLKDAGGKGWSQVFRVNSYHVPINNEAMDAMVQNFKKYMPDHQPIWTCVGVTRLGEDDMRVEIEVVAHVPQ
ncbi:uncharacterized protein N7446_001192 [Penicillium canescens]|uniref:Uncharacterized protein n=1 Tax=Penicillium canescens TaxID=5083 RepID=A0AAD6IC96_PENCN|nr:uncharacterized protein N7446_001192 [Penicillium canescens]KAJ6042996.1 hypothetical protein N7460_004351 [Penicillium canescens]KAJ6054469.1 hypothetical protein N7444_003567 [Penicillium canescens]KAJ6073415.1 hypothetical protein N7446_001192 [Penicillium canescens]